LTLSSIQAIIHEELGNNSLENMNHQELYKFIESVRKNVRCPQCGKQYTFENIEIRGIVESIMFLELHCQDHMPLLATVAISTSRKENKKEQITSNDVIEIYKYLKKFSGNFTELFENKPGKTKSN